MSLWNEWSQLLKNQTDESFDAFWQAYSDSEIRIYSSLLKEKSPLVKGGFSELAERYQVEPVYLMGFLDGVQTSLVEPFTLEEVTPDTVLDFEIDFEKLYFNMHAANADHLYNLTEWDGLLSKAHRDVIYKNYRRSKTVVKKKTPGRNDPCPCGSGKKYKKCCGKTTDSEL
jgi:hypothetical protein